MILMYVVMKPDFLLRNRLLTPLIFSSEPLLFYSEYPVVQLYRNVKHYTSFKKLKISVTQFKVILLVSNSPPPLNPKYSMLRNYNLSENHGLETKT